MDRPDAEPAELEAALRSLRGLNRYFGSYALVMRFIQRWMKPGDRLRIADLATGSADIPRRIAEHARKIGAEVEMIAVDSQLRTIENARRLSASYPEIRCELADVLTFGGAGEFDIVLCSLALHHFSDADAVLLLRRARELSRRFVLVADLRRGLVASAGVYLLTALVFRDPMTRADGRTSAARAFSYRELREIATRAGWSDFGTAKFRFARQAVWLEHATR
jgi:SAM-dependent methyltransferase